METIFQIAEVNEKRLKVAPAPKKKSFHKNYVYLLEKLKSSLNYTENEYPIKIY